MEVQVQAGNLGAVASDAIVVNIFEEVKQPGGATGVIDDALGGVITRLIATGDFTGKLNQTAVLYPAPGPQAGGIQAARVIVVGLGKREEFSLDRVRQASATAARKARDLGIRSLATIVHGAGIGGLSPRQAAQALTEGAVLGVYRYEALKSPSQDEDERRQLERLAVVEFDQNKVSELEAGITRGRVLAESACLSRDLVTQPGNVLTPRALAEAARQMSEAVGLRYEALGPEQIEALQMGALLGVAQGSDEPARFIIMEHTPPGTEQQAPLVLCGKAITFDSGGISIKPSEGMWEMKSDMGGGAAVVGAMRAIGLLGVPHRVVGLVAATENMPSGRAFRPGDVLRAMDGQTIEIFSTDAEGRLVLADTLAYGQRYNPVAMIDVATLTGGVITALGHGAAGVMANDADVVSRLKMAADATGEKIWELPLWDEEYKKAIRSDIADMKNTGNGRSASAIAGGMFLKQFAKKVPWAHLDIAGMAWATEDTPYRPKGATGYGVRLLTEFAAGFSE
ncbi:MAG TPA: leucyl aminopeptidase [Chloroflexota bacterium]|nr:leucyl aminopeptidase [Chloroflexota bacterium]